MKMKKLLSILLGVLLILALAACGSAGGLNGGDASSRSESDTTESITPKSSTAENDFDASVTPSENTGGKTLVVYYSATNNTEAVAGYIADATGGELFELIPVNPYTDDDLNYNNDDSRVSKEHDDPSLRTVELEKTVPDNWEDYDTVFIGYPIWWGIAAWPVDGFISANDFTGKTVIPFCTSASSGLGESGELLKEAAGSGNWLGGERFQSHTSEETVQEWVNGLGI